MKKICDLLWRANRSIEISLSKFCYPGDTVGATDGVEEAAMDRVRCAPAKLYPILTARAASYIEGVIYRACVQRMPTWESWAINKGQKSALSWEDRAYEGGMGWMCECPWRIERTVRICAAFWGNQRVADEFSEAWQIEVV